MLEVIHELDAANPSVANSTQTPATASPTEAMTHKVGVETLQQKKQINPALEVVLVGADFEKKTVAKIKTMETEANQGIEKIDLLLEASKELSLLKGESEKLSAKAKEAIQKLRDKGIDLLPDVDATFTKEQISSLKSSISGFVDQQRTKIQQIFTKIQTEIQSMSSVNDTVKKMIADNADAIRKYLERAGKH